MGTLHLGPSAMTALMGSPAGSEERCGLLLGLPNGAVEVLPTANLATSPADAFLIDPTALLEAAVSGRLIGCWHTHPAGPAVPSAADRRSMRQWPDLVHLVLGRTLRAWMWSSGGLIEVPVTCEETAGLLCSARP